MPETKQQPVAKIPFEKLAKGVRDWLASDTVTDIIVELNAKFGAFGSEVRLLPRLITRVAVGATSPENFEKEVAYFMAFLEPEEANRLVIEVKNRIFKPIKNALKGNYDIDIEKIGVAAIKPAEPSIRTMPLQKPAAPSVAPKASVAPRPTPIAPPSPKARVMEMARVIDLRRPVSTPPLTESARVTPKPVAQPGATTMKMEGNIATPIAPKMTNTTKPSVAATPKQSGEGETLEADKPFGLSESIPKPPHVDTELEAYEDHHPTVE